MITTQNMNLDLISEAEQYPGLVMFIHFESRKVLMVWAKKTMEVFPHYFEAVRNSRWKNRLRTAVVYADDEGAMRTYFALWCAGLEGSDDWGRYMLAYIDAHATRNFFSYELDFKTFWNYEEWSQREIGHLGEYAPYFGVLLTMRNPGDDTWEQCCVFRDAEGKIVEQWEVNRDRNLVCIHGNCGEPREVFETLEKYKGPLKRVTTKDDLNQIRLENVNL